MWFRDLVDYNPEMLCNLISPVLNFSDVSIIIPVKDNQSGINNFLRAFGACIKHEIAPREIIIVDNNSSIPIYILDEFLKFTTKIVLISCEKPGPGCARNAGCSVATGEWFLFTDSDCVPTGTLVAGYNSAMNGAVAYAGSVLALKSDTLSSYYMSEGAFIPPQDSRGNPRHFVTANALVWRRAFEAVGGFDELFTNQAAAEDVDLAYRLRQVGILASAPASQVMHDFGGWRKFVRRFIWYGRGNRRLEARYGYKMPPRPFVPHHKTIFNWLCSILHFLLMAIGYWLMPLRLNGQTMGFAWSDRVSS